MTNNFDMPSDEFKKLANESIDWICKYFDNLENFPVVSQVKPNWVKEQIPTTAPENPENFDNIFDDLENIILPGLTHWNHPNFMAYFNSTSAKPGILAELFTASFNVNGMLWKTSPAFTELEERMVGWFRNLLNLPEDFWGLFYDTASISVMHAIAAARHNVYGDDFRNKGYVGAKLPQIILYTSVYAHSSVEKAAITLGIGLDNVRLISCDDNFSMNVNELEEKINEDIKSGYLPFCIVATAGTTSVTSVDPIEDIVLLAKRYKIWLHIDAAYGGSAAILPEMQHLFKGWEDADSIVFNPHKWMFHPIDISVLFTKHKNILKQAFSLIPEYLITKDSDVDNLMDYGVQLGRRFRALKPWFIFRYFGTEKIRTIIREHIRLAKELEIKISNTPHFEIKAPVLFSTVCFRYNPGGLTEDELNNLNMQLMYKINESGFAFISHTKIGTEVILRIAISGLNTTEKHVNFVWELIQSNK